MSQINSFGGSSGGGGSGIQTINGDTGHVTGSTVTFSGVSAGKTVRFVGNDTTTMNLEMTDSNNNTIIGLGTFSANTGSNNTILGTDASATGSGAINSSVIIGYLAAIPFSGNFSTSNSTFVGTLAAQYINSGDYQTGIGYNALNLSNLGPGPLGDYNTCIGANAGSNFSGSNEASNIIIGNGDIANDQNTTRIGWTSGSQSQTKCFLDGISGISSTGNLVGITASGQLFDTGGTGGGVTSILDTANQITASSPTGAVTLTIPSTFIAPGSVSATTFVNVPTTASANVGTYQINGSPVLHSYCVAGPYNIFVGAGTGNFSLTNDVNAACGTRIMANATSCTGNSCLGDASGLSITSGSNNTLVGQGAGSSLTTQGNCTAIGQNAGSNSTGANNTSLGQGALQGALSAWSGSLNIGIGQNAGNQYTGTETTNIMIGAKGSTGDNNFTRIGYVNQSGTTGTQLGCWIDGIEGKTVTSLAAVLISSAGQLGTVSSSIRFKKNINDMGSASDGIMKLRPRAFDYKDHPSEFKSTGLIAEEVLEHMPELVSYDKDGQVASVRYHELPALLLNEIQKLNRRIEQLERRV